MKRIRGWRGILMPLVLTLGLGGGACSGEKSSRKNTQQEAFVEAQIEFQGAAERWVGPKSFVVYVDARGEKARLSFSPMKVEAVRAPAVEDPGFEVSASLTRTHLQELAQAILKQDPKDRARHSALRGCLHPIKVRLVRANGAVVEESGCHAPFGWPKLASETAHQFLSLASAGASASQDSQSE